MRKIISVLLILIISLGVMPVSANTEALSDDIVILYTNDVHTYIDGALSYDVIAAIKEELQKEYKYVYLVDAGDHVQGTAYGSMDNGESIIKMMNAADYDVATLGNHEFDYGMNGCLNIIDLAEFPYVSANFHHKENGVRGENVLDSYSMLDCGDEKLAIIGITTPETTSIYFKDESGSVIYGISAGKDGADLQQDVQKAIDDAKEEGATRIVALGHLGIDLSSQPWTSRETIAGVCGLDAFIDGHSHSTVKSEIVQDKEGHDVVLTQTGEYFDRIGMMVIDSETDLITTDFIECEEIIASDDTADKEYKLKSELYNGTELISDAAVKEIIDEWFVQIDDKLGQKIGSTELVFDNYDEEGNRLVRIQETNSGDFAADALYYLFDNMDMDVDVAIMNGGGIRNTAISGDITYKLCKDMHTFGNMACLQTVTGQQLLDALEWGARKIGVGEDGSFLQVSGLTYKIDATASSTVQESEMEIWQKEPDSYRVHDVKVYNKETNSWDALDLNAFYNLAGYNYTLHNFGDGYTMFEGTVNVMDDVMEDYMVLANYVQGFEGGVVDATNSPLLEKYPDFLIDYSTVNGSGRIEITDSYATDTSDDEVWVGGVQVTDENKNDVLGDGGSVKYNPATDTLTLTDATISNENGHGIYAYGINLTINGIDTDAEGSNTISGKCVEESGIDEEGDEYFSTIDGHGIFSEGDGFGGNGSVTVTGTVGNITAEGGNGICAYEDIVIKGNVGDISCSGGLSSGLSSDFGGVIIDKTGSVGDIASEEYNGISATKNVIISGNVGNINGSGYAGIHCTGGNVTISGSAESITGYAGGIEVYNSIDWDEDGNEVYTGGSAVISGRVGKVSGGVVGIYTAADLDISGSLEVSATDSEDSRALSVGGTAKTGNIVEPADYQINSVLAETYENEDGVVEVWHYTVCDNEGNPALTVKFEGWINPFEDVNTSAWYYDDVRYTVVNGLFSGTSEITFSPNINLTRAMLVTALYRNEGEPVYAGEEVLDGVSFEDVDIKSYYANAVDWAKQTEIVSGTSETTFAPNDNITREQVAAIMHRYAKYKGYDVSVGENTNILSYADAESISEYAIASVQYAVGSGLMKGKTDSTINPQDNATRAEIAAILHRFIEANK